MKTRHFTFVALASVLFASTIWSCNRGNSSTELADTRSARDPQPASSTPGSGDSMLDPLRAGCPMVVPGADVSVTDTEGGVALGFTTADGDVADLRTRVQRLAQMYESHRAQVGMMWHPMGGVGMGHGGPGMGGEGMGHGGAGMGGEGMGHGGPGMGGEGMGHGVAGTGSMDRGHGGAGMGGEGKGHMAGRGPMPAASTTITDSDSGARIEFRPADPARLDDLREHLRSHQQRMHSGECWMPQNPPTDTPRGELE